MANNNKVHDFIERWRSHGYEKGESQLFWIDLLQSVLGVEHATEIITFEDQVHLDHTSFIDAYIKDTHVMIEQKSINKNLRDAIKQSDGSLLTPFQQAKRYASELPRSLHPRWIVTCNFKSFLIYDMENPQGEPTEIFLEDLEKEAYRLQFLVKKVDAILQRELQVSIQAGEIVGKLYDAFLVQYQGEATADDLHSLNVLCVRLVFCLYAEDAGIFEKDQFVQYLQTFKPENMRLAIIDLFKILDTPIAQRDRFLEPKLKAFPYVNGSLFKQQPGEVVPPVTESTAELLIQHASLDFDWSDISPTIFGAVFESTLNPETRRTGGMHYTSIENIHKVIDPLFMDDLNAEFDSLVAMPKGKQRTHQLEAFQDKLGGLKFLDPACGSGNFLTETYVSLRRLENKVINQLTGGQTMMGFEELNPIKVHIQQFYGIEINDFAATVAKTALWIAEAQMMNETARIIQFKDDYLPLKAYENIKEGNALRIDWNDVCPASELNYIIGNPPFVGQAMRTKEQADDMQLVFAPSKAGGKLDYVAGWYKKAADMMELNNRVQTAFVSSNSICQGESVNLLWEMMSQQMFFINFAHTSFKWASESKKTAAVSCVIVGFSKIDKKDKYLFFGEQKRKANHINGYLKDAPDVFIKNRSKSINSSLAKVVQGSPPADDGRLLLSVEEKEQLLSKYPELAEVIKPFIGSREFINDTSFTRYCLWFDGVAPSKYIHIPELLERFNYIREYRLNSPVDRIQKTADKPYLFTQNRQPESEYLIIPRVSSERRRYIPVGFLGADVIASDSAVLVNNASIYDFGIISSNVHNGWMRTVAGRLESRYRYAPSVFYNFPFPKPTEEQRQRIEQTAQAILDARRKYPDNSLADMYGDAMYLFPELLKAHQDNDRAVMASYGFPVKDFTESDCVAELFKMYKELTEKKR